MIRIKAKVHLHLTLVSGHMYMLNVGHICQCVRHTSLMTVYKTTKKWSNHFSQEYT